MRFASGDLQGRSMRLGEPTKVVINGTAQPTVVAAAPPMHVDYTAPVGETKKQVLNLSAVPDSFTTSYETEEKSSNQSSSTHTTSWSFGAKESFGASFEIGSVDEGDGLKYSDTFTAAQDLKGSTANTHGTYSLAQLRHLAADWLLRPALVQPVALQHLHLPGHRPDGLPRR